MAIEIRELVIKTEIHSGKTAQSNGLNAKEVDQLRNQLLEECKRMLYSSEKRKQHNR